MVIVPKIRELLQRPDCILSRGFRLQLLATLVADVIIFSHGIAVGWLSPTLTKLQSTESPLNFPVTITEASWVGSLVGLGSLVGNIMFGFLLDLVGRKACTYMLAVPHIGLWILIYTAQSIEYLYLARFLGGMCGGGSYCVLSIFISEIADTSVRGTLSSMLMLSMNMGITVGFVVGTYLSYHLIPLVVVVLPVAYLLGMSFFPETPYHLLRKGKYLAAEKAFKFYHNCSGNNYSELVKCNEKFDELKVAITKSKSEVSLSYKDFITKRALKAFGLATVLLFVNQFCGIFAFVNYMSRIFAAAGSALDPDTSTMIIGGVQICGSYTAVLFVDRFGRKILLLISTGGMALSMGLFGLYTYFAESSDLTAYNWVPLVLMTVYIFIANLGIVAVTFVVFIELFPAKIRSLAISYCMAGISTMVFVVLKIFPIYLHTFGISITMWSTAVVSLGGCVFFLLFLPETKGCSLTDEDD